MLLIMRNDIYIKHNRVKSTESTCEMWSIKRHKSIINSLYFLSAGKELLGFIKKWMQSCFFVRVHRSNSGGADRRAPRHRAGSAPLLQVRTMRLSLLRILSGLCKPASTPRACPRRWETQTHILPPSAETVGATAAEGGPCTDTELPHRDAALRLIRFWPWRRKAGDIRRGWRTRCASDKPGGC